MYRITSHQVANLYWPGPSRLAPTKGEFTLRMGTHVYTSIPPAVLERIEVMVLDGLAELDVIDDTAVAS